MAHHILASNHLLCFLFCQTLDTLHAFVDISINIQICLYIIFGEDISIFILLSPINPHSCSPTQPLRPAFLAIFVQANLQELESTTGVSKEEVGLLRNLIENLPSTATPSTSPSKKGKAPATTVTVPPPSPQPSSASATPKSEPKFKATAKAPAAAAAVVGPSMVDGPLEPWPSCAAPQPATELSFLGGMLRSKPPPPPPKAVGGAASLEANGMSFEDIMARVSSSIHFVFFFLVTRGHC